VRVTGGIAFGGDSDFRPQVKTAGPGIRIGVEANRIGLHFVLFVVPGILDDV